IVTAIGSRASALSVVTRILPDKPIDRLPDEVGVTHVARVFLDHVDEEPPQGGVRPSGPSVGGEPAWAGHRHDVRGNLPLPRHGRSLVSPGSGSLPGRPVPASQAVSPGPSTSSWAAARPG